MAEKELFRIMNSEWTIEETTPGLFQISTARGKKKMRGLLSNQVLALNAIVAELDRYLKEKGGQ